MWMGPVVWPKGGAAPTLDRSCSQAANQSIDRLSASDRVAPSDWQTANRTGWRALTHPPWSATRWADTTSQPAQSQPSRLAVTDSSRLTGPWWGEPSSLEEMRREVGWRAGPLWGAAHPGPPVWVHQQNRESGPAPSDWLSPIHRPIGGWSTGWAQAPFGPLALEPAPARPVPPWTTSPPRG